MNINAIENIIDFIIIIIIISSRPNTESTPRTIVGERDVDETVVDVVFTRRQIKRAPVIDAETRQFSLLSTPVAQRLFPQ